MSFTRFPIWRRWFGTRSEKAAGRFLRTLGYRILAYNQADRFGEIDLLALDGETLVVVEVRSSETSELEALARTVHFEKQKRLTDAVLRFLQSRGLLNRVAVRFDVIALRWPSGTREPQILHLRHAFESVGKFQLHA